MNRTEQLGVRVSPEIKEQIVQAAKEEDRSLSSLVELILREWVGRWQTEKTKP